jgi:hypothetical protein
VEDTVPLPGIPEQVIGADYSSAFVMPAQAREAGFDVQGTVIIGELVTRVYVANGNLKVEISA